MNHLLKFSPLLASALLCSCGDKEEKSGKPFNVLFIVVDDLRPELGCYGKSHIHSPHIDKLAAESVLFSRAYCNIPVSGASRISFLTGTRPTRNSLMYYDDRIDEQRPGVPTLGKYFRDHGYHTIHNGKIMHHKGDAPGSWTEEWWPPSNVTWRDYEKPENVALDTSGVTRGPAYENVDVHDTAYNDGKTAEKTITDLARLSKAETPFFLAVGFLKPHLPFNAPRKYWELYDSSAIQLPESTCKPKNAPDLAMHNSGELRHYADIPPSGPVSDKMARDLIHGYYACVSYTDAQVGKVLNALDSLELSDNTIVVLLGDHGFNLREHGLWCKHSNFNTSLNAPLIIRAPGIKRGVKTDAIAEFVDVYPTLCEMTSLPVPDHAEGISLVNVMKDPASGADGVAVSRWMQGYTIIKDNYFYTEWSDSSDKVYASMLFDHAVDPHENVSVSDKPENDSLIQELSSELREHRGSRFEN
ncbi:MAG: sulfatase [Bacteroidota bacterium]